ncbi:ABC transporter ATP-binding protein [Tateyamaria sp.]|uniref:ABC transporter ATP-binding protein n=1 Tax=Tateyamaria sp. TaxID=1929288 RepID=UPI00329D3B48
MTNVSLTEIKKSYGAVPLFENLNLEIASGEFVVFVGPSGSGKSTLLRMIAGLESVTDGVIEIDGEDVTYEEPSDRGIAMVFQNYALYPHMDVYGNIAFNLRLAKISKDEIHTRVMEAARILRLEDLLKRSPAQLSGGQRQRVAIGRAIVRKPKVFLFDEPLSNLDAALRTQMRLEIETLHREIGATMIYVTHDQTEAMTLADRIVALDYGEIQQVGTPDELYNTPSNTFVAGFIGSPKANFLKGLVQSATENTAIVHVDGAASGAIEVKAENLKPGDHVQLGVRPEEFNLSLGALDESLVLMGHVETADRLGNITYAYVNAGLADLITVQTFQNRKIKAGEEVTLSVAQNRIDVFNPDGIRCSPAKT